MPKTGRRKRKGDGYRHQQSRMCNQERRAISSQSESAINQTIHHLELPDNQQISRQTVFNFLSSCQPKENDDHNFNEEHLVSAVLKLRNDSSDYFEVGKMLTEQSHSKVIRDSVNMSSQDISIVRSKLSAHQQQQISRQIIFNFLSSCQIEENDDHKVDEEYLVSAVLILRTGRITDSTKTSSEDK